MLNKYKGVPNSHLGILFTYIMFGVFLVLLILVSGIQKFLDTSPLDMGINWVSGFTWVCTVGAIVLFSLFICVVDFIFWYMGYRSEFQMPLHKVVRAFYKKNDAPYSVDNTGKIYKLSNSELGDRNRAIRNMYLKPFDNGLVMIIPCTRWGFLGVSSSVIDNLRDERGSLDMAQNIVSNAFKGYRISIRHYHIKGNHIFWYLIK